MARFLTKLNVEYIDDDKWRLISPLLYESDIAGSVAVPSGFETDFASVPRAPFVYLLFGDEAHKAATVHDYLYRSEKVSRKTADQVFLEAMKISGVWAWRRYPMFWAVRLFGGLCNA
jgi:hypothetical protein